MEELISQLQAYDNLLIEIKHMPWGHQLIAERWIKNYQQMTGSTNVPLDVLEAIVNHVRDMKR